MIRRNFFVVILAGILAAASPVGAGQAADLSAEMVTAAANHARVSRVLYINSYDRGYPWSDDIERGLVERIKNADSKIELSVEYLDGLRFPETTRNDLQAAALAAKYAGYRHDVVVVSDNFAFDFAIQYRKRLFPDLPIVFCGYNNFRPEVLNGVRNITGVNEEVDFTRTVDLAIRVQPAVRHLAFITSTGDASNRRMAEVTEATLFPALRNRYHLIVLKDASMAEIRARLGALPPDSAVFLIGMTSDLIEGRRPTPVENGRMISAVSPVPVYAFWDFHLGSGVLGGYLITGLDQGRTAADMALRILDGTPADDIPVMMQTPARTFFDFKVMKKYGIKVRALPEECSFINWPVSPWERYGWYIGAAVLAMSLEALLIIALVLSLRQRKQALRMLGIERDRLEQRVEARTGELKHSLSLLSASLESTVDGILIVGGQGKIARWNQKFARMWKIPEDVLSNLDVEKAIGHVLAQLADPEQFVAKIRELHDHPEQTSFDQIELASGRVFERYSQPQRIEDEIVGRVWSFRDITERKRAEEQVRRSEAKYRTLLENIPQKIFYKDRNSVYAAVNPSYAKDLGMLPEDFVGKTDYDFFPNELADKYRTDDRRVMTRGVAEELDECYISGGETKTIHTVKAPVYDENGAIGGVLGIFWDITERKRAEEALQQAHDELEHRVAMRTKELMRANAALSSEITERRRAEDTLRLLSSRLLTSQEEEQRRIAMELHDQTGQDLSVLKLSLAGIQNRLRKDQTELKKECDKILTVTDSIIEDVRRLAHGLNPSQLQILGLRGALKALIQNFSEKTRIPIRYDVQAFDNGFRPETQIVLYRIFQEALTNIYKHAQAKTVRIDVCRQGNALSISIGDDGRGFDPCRYRTSEPTAQRGMGLSALELRSRMINADLKISSQPGQGTEINLLVPIKGNCVADRPEMH